MRFDDPQNVRVDPTQGGLYTAAHEIIHAFSLFLQKLELRICKS